MLINQNNYPNKIYITKTNKPDYLAGLKTTIKSSGCGICCGMMVADFFNQKLSIDEAIELSYSYKANTSAGTKYKEYSNALCNKLNLTCSRSNNINDLYECLDNNGCCVVNIKGNYNDHIGYFSNIGHYLFIFKHNKDDLFIYDPDFSNEKYQLGHRKSIKIIDDYLIADYRLLLEDIGDCELPYFLFNKSSINNIYQEIDQLYNTYLNKWIDIVKIDSPSNYKEGVDKVGDYFINEAKKENWDIEILNNENSGNAINITMNSHSNLKPIIISGHMDTVHKIGSMDTFIKDGKLFGPGATDCKGGLIVGLLTMKALKNIGFKNRPISLLLQSDEEVGSKLSNYQTINWMIEKSKNAEFFLNTEMYQKDTVVLERKGILKVEIESKGISAHSSICYDGSSAIKNASYIVIELEKLQDPENITISVGIMNGGSAANVVPDNCVLTVDIRYNKESDIEYINKYIEKCINKEYVKGCSATYKIISKRPAMALNDKNICLLNKINEIMIKENINQLTFRKTNGGSDASNISLNDIPTIDSIGVSGKYIHSPNEYADIDSLKENAKRICAIIINY